MPRLRISGLLSFAALMVAPACTGQVSSSSDSQYKLIEIEMQLEAGAEFFDPWPSGKTIHSGVGYIRPFGATDYWCGVGYKEEEAFRNSREQHRWLIDNAIDSNPLFCIYRTQRGDLYVLDVLIGSIAKSDNSHEKQDSVTNIVLGGTNDFKDASGVWVGATSGRGEEREVAPGLMLPASILKLMDGYVRLPAD